MTKASVLLALGVKLASSQQVLGARRLLNDVDSGILPVFDNNVPGNC
jgi:hypothetical protein